jgi:Holliday junction resolvasome RuvABC endonuclease subunit
MTTAAKKPKKERGAAKDSTQGADIFSNNAAALDIKKENILALDVATNTGFATSVSSGTWNFTPRKDESKGMRLLRFQSKLRQMLEIMNLKMVVFEAAVSYGKFPNMVGAEMIGILKLFCEEHKIEYASYTPSEIKKFSTGKGNADKDAMVSSARLRWGMQSFDDNEADALAIFHHTLDILNLNTKETII